MKRGRPIIVGVDGSAASTDAAQFAANLAERAHAPCYLVHAVQDVESLPLMLPVEGALDHLTERLEDDAQRQLHTTLSGRVPPSVIDKLTIRGGSPVRVLADAVHEHRAGMVVLGGKHHAAPVRWFGGSTAHDAIRAIDVPVLITAGEVGISRILVAIDLAETCRTTLEHGVRLAALYSAELRVIFAATLPTVVEDVLPLHFDADQYVEQATQQCRRMVREVAGALEPSVAVRLGPAVSAIVEEAKAWNADLLVAGSHGKSWMERALIGSTTARLLTDLPTSLLVVPVTVRAPELHLVVS